MNSEQRPREKARRYGPQALNDEELICLLVGSGTPQAGVVEISRKILDATDQLAGLFELQFEQLKSISGIGDAKALQLMASVELARRALKVKTYRTPVHNAQDVVQWLQAEYGSKGQEYFIGLFLDGKGKMICHKVLSIGTLDQMVLHPREILREAYLCSSSTILFAHNHPSGDVRPSLEDLQTTRRLIDAAEIAGIPVVDHIIISNSSWFSFRQHDLLCGSRKTMEDTGGRVPEGLNPLPSLFLPARTEKSHQK